MPPQGNKQQVGQEQSVKIVSCDPTQRRVEGQMKDAGIIQISVNEIPPAFRWPRVGEFWKVTKEFNKRWVLVGLYEEKTAPFGVEKLKAGQAKINASIVRDEGGHPFATSDAMGTNAAEILDALDEIKAMGGGEVWAPAGHYVFNDYIIFKGNNLHLRLSPHAIFDFSAIGHGNTGVDGQAGFNVLGSEETPVNLVGSVTTGDTTINVSNGHSFSAGDYIRVGSNVSWTPATDDSDGLLHNIGEICIIKEVEIRNPEGPGVGDYLHIDGIAASFPPTGVTGYRASDDGFVQKLNLCKNITISGGIFVGAGNGHGQQGINISRAQNVTVRGTQFQGFEQDGINYSDVVDGVVDDITFLGTRGDTDYGVACVYATQDVRIVNSYFQDCRHSQTTDGNIERPGVPRRIVVANNQSANTTNSGFDCHAGCEDISFIGNTAVNSENHGINIRCPQAIAKGNLINGAVIGIRFIPQTDKASRVLVDSNEIRRTQFEGILYTRPPEASLLGTAAGLYVEGVTISNNQITDTNSEPIYVSTEGATEWDASLVSIRGNTIGPNATGKTSVTFIGHDAIISDNVIPQVASGQAAIRLGGNIFIGDDDDPTPFASQRVSVMGNLITGADLSFNEGIRVLNDSDNIAIVGNVVSGVHTGIAIADTATNCIVTGNNTKDCVASTPTDMGVGNSNVAGKNQPTKVFNLDAAEPLILVNHTDQFDINVNGTNISNIGESYAGRVVTLRFDGVITLNDGVGNLALDGNYTTGATTNSTITLMAFNDSWVEVARSIR
jgi:parallel beta-helix repeat protein